MPKTTKLYIFILILGFNLTDEVCGNSCVTNSLYDKSYTDWIKSHRADDQRMYGYTCKSDSDCKPNSNNRFSLSSDNFPECENGRCNCTTGGYGACYNSDVSRFECKHFSHYNSGRSGADCEKEECGPNSICVKGRSVLRDIDGWLRGIDDYKCVCNDGYLEVSKECREVHHVSAGEVCSTPKTGPLQFCDINSNKSCIEGICTCIRDHYNDPDIDACIAKEDYIGKYKANVTAGFQERCTTNSSGLTRFCDEAAHMNCLSEKCQCHKDFYHDTSRGPSLTCKSKASFVAEHNLMKYQVMPGEYCHADMDCIEGLTCHNYNCSCPYPCEYISSSSACDCGEVSATEGAVAAILVGIIGGILIIIGWGYLIKKQIRYAKGGENRVTASIEGNPNCRNSSPASYPLRPVGSTSNTALLTQGSSSSHQATSQYPSSAPALPHKHSPMDSASPFNPPNALPTYPYSMSQPPPPYNPQPPAPYNPKATPPYASPTYQQPTAPPTGITVPLAYQAPSSNPEEPFPDYPSAPSQSGASYPGAPYTAEPYSSAPPYYGATSQPDAPYTSAPGGTSSGIPSEPPPAYTPTAVDIYKPTI